MTTYGYGSEWATEQAMEQAEDAGYYGDARRCPKHPEVKTSSPDGMFDAPCGKCEAAMEYEIVEATAHRIEEFAYNKQKDGSWAFFQMASSLGWKVGATPAEFTLTGRNAAHVFEIAEVSRNSEGETTHWTYRSKGARNVTITVWND